MDQVEFVEDKQPLENLKGHGLPKETIFLQIFKRLSPANSTLSHLFVKFSEGLKGFSDAFCKQQ